MMCLAVCVGVTFSTQTSMGNAIELTSVARDHGCTAVAPVQMPSFDTVDKGCEALATAAVALAGAVLLSLIHI
eukprot:15406975-Alexandrium_andersonii.AAC.1